MKIIRISEKADQKKQDDIEDSLIDELAMHTENALKEQSQCARVVSKMKNEGSFQKLTTYQKGRMKNILSDIEHLANQFEMGAKTIKSKIG